MSAGGAGSLQTPCALHSRKRSGAIHRPAFAHRVALSCTRLSRYRSVETRGAIHDGGSRLESRGRVPTGRRAVLLQRRLEPDAVPRPISVLNPTDHWGRRGHQAAILSLDPVSAITALPSRSDVRDRHRQLPVATRRRSRLDRQPISLPPSQTPAKAAGDRVPLGRHPPCQCDRLAIELERVSSSVPGE